MSVYNIKLFRCVVFITALWAGGGVAVAQDINQIINRGQSQEPQTTASQPSGAQVQSLLQSGRPEQAATLQLGLTPDQLNSLVGPRQPEQPTTRKFKYTPKDPTEVETPPRLFNNIPKWQ